MNTKWKFSLQSITRRRDNWQILSIVLALLLVTVSQGNVAYGQDQTPLTLTIDGSSSSTIQYKTNKDSIKVAPNLTLTGGSANEMISQARVFLSGISGKDFTKEDKLSLEGQTGTQGNIGSIQWTYDETNGILTFSGEDTAANYQAALRLVTYTYTNQNSPRPADRTVEFAIGSALFNPDNGHFYDFIEKDGITWTDARDEAAQKSYLGRQGYLATITSAKENEFVAGKLKGQGWMGASDAGTDKEWYWVTGPEKGTLFFYQKGYNASGDNACGNGPADNQPPGNPYANWANNEPNDADTNDAETGAGCAGEEDYAHFFDDGTWNDYPNDPKSMNNSTWWRVDGYVVEYGGMPGDNPVDSSLTGKVTISYLRCHSCGDVHISTPDGLRYDFQATGEFLAVQSSDGKVVVQARQETYPVNPEVSVNTAVAFMVDGDKLEFYVKPKPVLYLNDVETELPSSTMTLPNGGRIDPWSGTEYYITWPDGRFAARVVMYPGSHLDYGIQGHGDTFEGLLGNLDGNPLNDLQIRDGDQIKPPPSIADLNRFGDSWRVSTTESLFRDVEGVTKQPHTLVVIEEEKKKEAENTCRDGGVTHELALKNCVYDVALTDDPIFVESAKDVEESVEDLPPSAIVPATAGETLGGVIFDADLANEEGITIVDGDDLVITTGKSEDGAGYIRFNIYRDGEYVVSFSVGADTEVADALAGAMAATLEVAEEELPAEPGSSIPEEDLAQVEEAATVCAEGVRLLADNMYEYPAEVDGWAEVYQVFSEKYLPACDYIGTFLSTYAGAPELTDVEALFEELGIEGWSNLFAEGGSEYGITFHGSRMVQFCPDLHQVQYDCVTGAERISNSIDVVLRILE